MFIHFLGKLLNIETMLDKFIIISIIGAVVFNLIILLIVKRRSQDKKLLDYLKKTSKL